MAAPSPFRKRRNCDCADGRAVAIATASTAPRASSQTSEGRNVLTQSSAPAEVGRVQGLFSTAETAGVAVAAAAGGALFGAASWAPFVAGASAAALLGATLPIVGGPLLVELAAWSPITMQ
jgi:hypothetical protein